MNFLDIQIPATNHHCGLLLSIGYTILHFLTCNGPILKSSNLHIHEYKMKGHLKMRGNSTKSVNIPPIITVACCHGPFIRFDCPIMQNTTWQESSLLSMHIHGINFQENDDKNKQEIEIEFDTSFQFKYFNILISI